ncbi:MAG TPA: UbiD family decarboxylase domain-containing protein [Phycisphaerales bacterium]|nr:UbiD family decarboxylase domain-containing protein [Phycisphaerales bacterium]
MYETTQDFVRALAQSGELKRISARVSPILEISEITDRVSKSPAPSLPSPAARRTDPRHHANGGHALLFDNVEGSDWPVLINAYGSYRRVEMALGCDPAIGLEGLADRIGKLIKPEPPPTLLAKLQKLPELLELARIPPKKVRTGLCQEVTLTGDQIDLRRLPLLRCWPHDGDLAALGYPADINHNIPGVEHGPEWDAKHRGRYITLAGIHTIHRDDLGHPAPPSRNIGMYRVQFFGKRTLAMHWHMHHDGARHWRSWKARGERMPVAIVLGGESVLPYAATAPMPPGISELLLAGFLNKGAIPLVDCKTVPLAVPANAEIVIEGYVDTRAGFPGFDPRVQVAKWQSDEVAKWDAGAHNSSTLPLSHSATLPLPSPLGSGAVFEGPFGDHTGFYSLPDRYPILEVTAITHRKNPIYPTTIVGLPPQEDYYLGKATERLFLPLLRTIVPDIIDYDLPMFGAFHNCAFLKIKKEYPYHARRVMHAIWGAGQMSWTKSIVVVDEDIDLHDTNAVMAAVGDRCVPARDTELVRGPLDILDHAAPFLGAGGKIGFDATRKTSDAETHPAARSQSPVAAEVCRTTPINAVLADDARRAEQRIRELPHVLDAAIPGALAGHWLLIKLNKTDAARGPATIKALGSLPNEVAIPRYIILVGPDADVQSIDSALFHWLANSDPQRDHTFSLCGRRVAFDATPKLPTETANGLPCRDWPPIITMDEPTKTRVTQRWPEYSL